jgi:putative hydrolase of the HAD superfamily
VLRAVLFDLDGTLLNRRLAHERFILDQAARFRADLPGVSPEAYLEVAVRFDRNGMAARKEAFPQIARELALSAELAERLMSDYLARFPASCTLFPGVDETLDALRRAGLRLGLITNGSTVMQGGKLDAVGLRPKLDAILISQAEGLHKPDEAIFRLAAARLDAVPAHCVFVGDNPDADIRGAKGAGMRAVWVRDAWWDEPKEADAVIDHIPQLSALVESWRA